ncbi:MAG: formate C-acetyltransferase/glycerol dehydratase family glycyl radical enzyme [Bacteroidetes bacterium]|nr:MAG: formate C-acetyltransferase/glycerol dehydratase family glycyl radical enzyme [Bacteroidota bacterium]
MNNRIKILRQNSLDAIPYISEERGMLLTEFYQKDIDNNASVPVKRARALSYILNNKKIYIGKDELIVGERGPEPKATPTYPEICVHTREDLQILNDREKVSFRVSDKTRKVLTTDVAQHWSGNSMRERIFEAMSPEWKDCYDAGIFTEFLEQRAPGHTVLDDKIYRMGMLDFKNKIRGSIEKLDFINDPEANDRKEELMAMDIVADALISFALRHADALAVLADKETDDERKAELLEMEKNCRHIPANPPENFWQALQYYWFVHLAVITELNPWDSFNPGRLDQHLFPFFQREMGTGDRGQGTGDKVQGTGGRERVKELLQAFWIKFNNHPAPPKVGITARESNTYTDFSLINTGGVKADGSDAVNELSFLILDVIEEMRLVQPSSMVQVSKKTPDAFVDRALRIVKTGFGQPSIFNTDAIIQEMLRQGKDLADARNGGASGCVETGAFGKEAYILTGYFNLPKVLEITLNNGIDPRSGKKIGPETGNPESFESVEGLLNAFNTQLRHFIDIKIRGNNIIEGLYAHYLPVPFLSLITDDCIEKGKDYNAGGARYNTNYIQGVGIGSITDMISAVSYHIYDKKTVSFTELMDAVKADFIGHEELRKRLWNETPKYGNDDDYADSLMLKVFEMYFDAIDGRPNMKGGHYRINMLPTTCHIYFGSVCGATPDGRHAGKPLSEGISPMQGADFKGPTAVLKSASKMDHLRTGGTLLNQKFTPSFLEDKKGITAVRHLIRSYFSMDGHHIQFNVVDAGTLRKAKKHPEEYRDLIVRVAGYSDYFIDLTEELQDEIIRRTEHTRLEA